MSPKIDYCGCHLTTCAIVVAIFGIFMTISAVTIATFSEQYIDSYPIWIYIGIGIIIPILYILVFIGIAKNSYAFLIPAEILLGIKVIATFIFIIWFILSGLYLPETIFKEFKIIYLFNDVRIAIRNVFFTIAFMAFLHLIFVIYSFFIIRSTRQWLASDSQNKRKYSEVESRRSLSQVFNESENLVNDSRIPPINFYYESPRLTHFKKQFNEDDAILQQTRIFIPSRYPEFYHSAQMPNYQNSSTKIEYFQSEEQTTLPKQPLIYRITDV